MNIDIPSIFVDKEEKVIKYNDLNVCAELTWFFVVKTSISIEKDNIYTKKLQSHI